MGAATVRRHLLGSAPRRGVAVTFSGLDGAGKSSQATLLQEALRRHGVEAAVEWVPVAINPSIGRLQSIGKRILGGVGRRAVVGGDGGDAAEHDPGKRLVRRSTLARHLWSSIVTSANVLSHWRSVLRHRRAADVVIFDRYALDTAVRLHTWYGHFGSVAFQVWLIKRLSPRPICSYFLDVPAERALARKVDKWDLPILSDQAQLYRSECGHFGVRRLDGERAADDLAAEISADVLRRIGVTVSADCR
jgi:thymidylate kinase